MSDSLEGEILQQRYAIVAVHATHGDWVRCRVYDMQDLSQREAVIQLEDDGNHEIELLPEPDTTDGKPDSSKRAKPGKLEAAWFALGAESDGIPEEDQPDVGDGDLLIAPEKVEQRAGELTTKTYLRYRVDSSEAQLPAIQDSGAETVAPARRPTWIILAAAGAGIAVLAMLLLFLR